MTGMKVVVRFARDCKSLAGVGAMFALPPAYPIASLMPSGLFPCRLWLTHRFWLQINISPHLSSSGPFCVGFGVIIEGPNLLDLLVPSLPPPGEIGLVLLPDWVFIHFCLSFFFLFYLLLNKQRRPILFLCLAFSFRFRIFGNFNVTMLFYFIIKLTSNICQFTIFNFSIFSSI